MDIEKIFFAFIVEDFNGIKKIYKRNPQKAYELFKKKLEKVDKKLSKNNFEIKSLKVDWL